MTKKHRFARGMLIYAVVVLLLGAAGLAVLWMFLDAYEQSRPGHTVSAYVSSLTPETICTSVDDFLDTLNTGVQSREESLQVLREALTEPFRAEKDAAKSDEEVLHYYLYCGKQRIGDFWVRTQGKGRFGFPTWAAETGSYDFSYLKGEDLSITVPDGFSVLANGNRLDGSAVSEKGVHFQCFEEFYDSFDLPTMVTYTVSDYLGEVELSVQDPTGAPISLETLETDPFPARNYTDDEQEKITALVGDFLTRYIRFSGSSKTTARGNLGNLTKVLVPGGALAKRLSSALDGLQFGQSILDKLVDTQYNHMLRFGEDHYYCDVTYLVDTTGKKGVVQTTNHMRLILTEINGKLYVEAISSYSADS